MPKHPRRRSRRKLAALALSVLCLAGFLYWSNTALQVTRFSPAFTDLPAGFDGCRIVVLSDLHGAGFGRHHQDLFDKVAAEQPEYIFFLGDLEDKYRGPEDGYAAEIARGLSAIAPTYYVTGNHEWAAHAVQELEPLLEENGVHVLSNTYVMLERGGDKIALLGAEDSNGYADQKTIAELSEEVRQEQGDVYKILLSHRNTRIEEYVDAHIDLTLCGHAHGGLIRLPGTDGLIGPHREFFPSYTAGLYDLPYGQLVASRGLGNQFPAFRLFNRPDVPVVVLE